MNLLENQSWTLKDKDGKSPTAEMLNKLENILKLNKKQLFPCPGTPDELEMQKTRDTAPREMNSFMIFRRQLAIIVKRLNLSDDGKILSRAASYIWNGASKDEKKSYLDMAEELKRRHLAKYPDYTYERRKRKTADEDFVFVKPESIRQKKKKTKNPKPKTNAELNPVSEECASTSTSLSQEQENIKWSYGNTLNPMFTSFDPSNSWNCDDTLLPTYFLYSENPRDLGFVNGISLPSAPVMNMVLSPNYTNMGPQDLNQLQRQVHLEQQQLQQQINLPPQQISFPNDNYLIEGGDSGIDQSFGEYYALEAPIDKFF